MGIQQSFIRGGSAPWSNPLTSYTPFLTEKLGATFVYLSLTNGAHFIYIPTSLELCILLTAVNSLSYNYE